LKIRFYTLESFREECVEKDISIVRMELLEKSRRGEMGTYWIDYVLLLTATDGVSLLELREVYDIKLLGEKEWKKEEIEKNREKVEERVREEFKDFTLKRGVIEKVD